MISSGFFWLIFLCCVLAGHAKFVCFETKSDIDGNLDISTKYNFLDNVHNLPRELMKPTSLQGNNVWYIMAPLRGGEVTIAANRKLYTNKARTVQIFIRYFSKSPRQPSLYPVKSNPSLVTLPISGNDWSEVTYDVDPNGQPVEISVYLSQGQYILFDTIVLGVDAVLPRQSPGTACQGIPPLVIQSPSSTAGSPSSPTSGRAKTASSGGSTPGILSPVPVITRTTPNECTILPPTECKCNCLCNCQKC